MQTQATVYSSCRKKWFQPAYQAYISLHWQSPRVSVVCKVLTRRLRKVHQSCSLRWQRPRVCVVCKVLTRRVRKVHQLSTYIERLFSDQSKMATIWTSVNSATVSFTLQPELAHFFCSKMLSLPCVWILLIVMVKSLRSDRSGLQLRPSELVTIADIFAKQNRYLGAGKEKHNTQNQFTHQQRSQHLQHSSPRGLQDVFPDQSWGYREVSFRIAFASVTRWRVRWNTRGVVHFQVFVEGNTASGIYTTMWKDKMPRGVCESLHLQISCFTNLQKLPWLPNSFLVTL